MFMLVLDNSNVSDIESFVIAEFLAAGRRLYNATSDGSGRIGYMPDLFHCLKISQSRCGKVKRSWMSKRVQWSFHKRKPVIGVSLVNGVRVYYEEVRLTERDGFSGSKATECCRGRRKVHKDFVWSYVC